MSNASPGPSHEGSGHYARQTRERSIALFGEVLPEYDLTVVTKQWRGDRQKHPGSEVRVAVYPTPTVRHAKFLALEKVTSGYSNTIWPKPGLQQLDTAKARPFGDEVYAMRLRSEYTMVSRIGTTVVMVRMSTSIPVSKQPRVPLTDAQFADWENWVANLMGKVRAIKPAR